MHEELRNFILREKTTCSCEWVVLRLLFVFAGGDGKISFQRLVEDFRRYYQRRLDAGLPVDKPASKIALCGALTTEKINIFIKNEPLKRLIDKGFLSFDEDGEMEWVGFESQIWASVSPSERAMLLAEIDERLKNYFTEEVAHPEGILPVPCVFCQRDQLKIVKENQLAVAVFDIFPAVPGHCLIIPKRHIRDVFGLTPEEMGAILELLQEMKKIIDAKYKPDGYNVGFNVGYSAGQTVMHAHLHCFPRKWGDVDNPHGGLRNIIPNWHKYPKD